MAGQRLLDPYLLNIDGETEHGSEISESHPYLYQTTINDTVRKRVGMNGTKRRIWEFQGFTICRILGFAFDEKETDTILRKLGVAGIHRKLSIYEKHGALVDVCNKPNDKSAKYVEKILEQRFEPYRRMLSGVDHRDICRFFESNVQPEVFKDIPIAALIWFASREPHGDVVEIEQRIFNVIHTLEHRAVRFYESTAKMMPQGKAESLLVELRQARKTQEILEQKFGKLERKREYLRTENEQLKSDKEDIISALSAQRRANDELKKLLERLGGESALEHVENLEREIKLLAGEVKALTDEVTKYDLLKTLGESETDEVHPETKPVAIPAGPLNIENERDTLPPLKGIRIAFIGGLESLSPHYQEMVEQLGGIFCGHDGRCVVKGDLDRVIRRADMVFCPVNPNSHNACRQVKKMCKYSGKPCCFLRSASLSMFRRELIQYARNLS